MKLSLAPMAAAVEDAPLLPNAKKKGSSSVVRVSTATTDSKTTTTKKGYIRLSVAFGTCAVLLFGVVFCADRSGGKINTNIVHNTIRSSGKEKLEYCNVNEADHVRTCYKGEECPGYPTDIKRGMCDTSGIYDHVLPFLNHLEVIPGRIYYGLEFTDLYGDSYSGLTYFPHDPPMVGQWAYTPCTWGNGKSVGRCIRYGDKPKDDDVHCPSIQRHIVHAWQECAELCNDQPECHTFTVKTQALLGHRDFQCYFHKGYECRSNNHQYAGIDNCVHHEDIREDKYDDLGVWSGICRSRYDSKNYACTNTPHATPTPVDCKLCSDQKNYCCHSNGSGWNFDCLGCKSSF